MSRFSTGEAARRTEDLRFLTGSGCYFDDMSLARQAHGAVVRSPHAAARIRAIDASDAAAMAGVLSILTGEDVRSDGLGGLRCEGMITGIEGRPPVEPARFPLAVGRVRHVGEPVAFVVAETAAAAAEAAERIDVDYDTLPAVASAEDAVRPGAPQVWDEAPGNRSFRWENGDRNATERAFAEAAQVVRVKVHNNRLVASPLEPRGALGVYDAGQDHYTLYTPTQGSHLIRHLIADGVFRIPETQLRVVTPDVGGGFGVKMYLYQEQVLVLWAARRLGRPVKWTCSRSEGFVSDTQGRDQTSEAELALDAHARFRALRVRTRANLGAYLSTLGAMIPTAGGTRALTGPYDISAAHVQVDGVFTNTVPVDAYRGAGRPEAVYLIERLVEAAARETGLDSVEIRRRNLVPAEAMPYTTALGQVIDSGDFARNLDDALEAADWNGFPSRREDARNRNKLRGIGLSTYMDPCGGNRDQLAQIRFDRSGGVLVMIGTQSTGQGHETAFAQIVSAQLGVPFDRVRVVEGDTDQVAYGRGTSGSRSLAIGGPALHLAAERVIAKARKMAAHMLEASEDDLEFAEGTFRVTGTDRAIGLIDVAKAAYSARNVPDGLDIGLDEKAHYMGRPTTYPNGCHVCEVEIDPDTGAVTVVRYTTVEDFGRVINPVLVEGQIHGGLAQGIGQALLEDCVYDESGQLVTGSLMDYGLPRAGNLPFLDARRNEVPCRTNVLGVKGCGEAGAIAAPPAVIAAVVDGLEEFGVNDVQMPATPQRVWQAMHRGLEG